MKNKLVFVLSYNVLAFIICTITFSANAAVKEYNKVSSNDIYNTNKEEVSKKETEVKKEEVVKTVPVIPVSSNESNKNDKSVSITTKSYAEKGKVYLPSSFEEAVSSAEKKHGIKKQTNQNATVVKNDIKDEEKPSKTITTEQENNKEAGITYLASIIYHSDGKSDLSNKDLDVLKKIVNIVKEKNAKIKIVGHASSRTSNMDLIQNKLVNYNISVARAERIKKELVRYGADESKITLVAVSDTENIKEEVMPVSESVNRRSEIYISY